MKDIRFGDKVMVLLLSICFVLGVAGTVRAQTPDLDLSGLLEQVGQGYAEGYVSPLVTAIGINQNSGMYHTAKIPKSGLTISFGLKLMASKLEDEDKTFTRVVQVDANDFNSSIPDGTMVDATMTGPTVFGPDTETGSVSFMAPAPWGAQSVDGIAGLVDADYMPLVAPEVSVGGIFGFKAVVRGLPEIDAGDIGKVKFLGYGLQYSINSLLPVLPVDIMVGYFTQSLDIGDIMETEATSTYVAVSKSLPLLTVYGGYSMEESSVDVSYESGDFGTVGFSADGLQDSRFTVGATLSFLLKINAEASFGSERDSYSAGLLFGF